MRTLNQVVPKGVDRFIQARPSVLTEEVVIDGKSMTVSQLAQGYRNEKVKTMIFGGVALAASAVLVATLYVHSLV